MSTRAEQTNKVPRCFTVDQLAEQINVSRRTVERAVWSGELEHYRLGARIVIPETAASLWLESHRIRSRRRFQAAA